MSAAIAMQWKLARRSLSAGDSGRPRRVNVGMLGPSQDIEVQDQRQIISVILAPEDDDDAPVAIGEGQMEELRADVRATQRRR
jgi:hypothetical protein